jgi:radical SAM superfamily enzyme
LITIHIKGCDEVNQFVPKYSSKLGCDAVPLGYLILESEALRSFETSGTTHQTTKLNIPDDLKPQEETGIDLAVQYTKQERFSTPNRSGSVRQTGAVHCAKQEQFSAPNRSGSVRQTGAVQCAKQEQFSAPNRSSSVRQTGAVQCAKQEQFSTPNRSGSVHQTGAVQYIKQEQFSAPNRSSSVRQTGAVQYTQQEQCKFQYTADT